MSFKEFLQEAISFKKGDPVHFKNPLGFTLNGYFEMYDEERSSVICNREDNASMKVKKGEFFVPNNKIKAGHKK